MEIQRFSSDAPWETIVGYSRVVRAGDLVIVSGTAATNADGIVVGGASMYEQTRFALERIEAALQPAGAELSDVVATRIYVTDISRWEEVGRAHREAFGETPPVTSMVGVVALLDPRMLVEIEAMAVVAEEQPG